MSSDDKHTERVLQALEDATRVKTELCLRVSAMEEQMGTMIAHLDNIAREASQQTAILREAQEERKAKEELETLALEHARKDEMDLKKQRRKRVHQVVTALWGVFSTPLATLLTAFVAWLIYRYFSVPS